jgi:site-specific recombinase XerD
MVHGLKDKKRRTAAAQAKPPPLLWNFGRTTAWKKVIAVMKAAGVKGPQATPKGLRHGFAVAAIQAGIPLNLLQRWLGHAQLTTTAIYANAVGPEERNIAARMWR